MICYMQVQWMKICYLCYCVQEDVLSYHQLHCSISVLLYNCDIITMLKNSNHYRSRGYRRQEKTIMKLVVDAETDKVLGASMCGPDAPEIMQVDILSWN